MCKTGGGGYTRMASLMWKMINQEDFGVAEVLSKPRCSHLLLRLWGADQGSFGSLGAGGGAWLELGTRGPAVLSKSHVGENSATQVWNIFYTSKYCTCSPAAFIHQILLWQWREFPHVIGVFQKTDSPADLEKMITDILGKLNRTSRGITLPWFWLTSTRRIPKTPNFFCFRCK